MQVSVAIIARDSEKFIAVCVSSLKSLSEDVVVVVDSRTVDNTAQVAAGLGCRVYVRDFDSFSGQKNFAASQTVNDWVLSLDTDETASPALVAAIKILPDRSLFQAYYLPRKNKIFGKYIGHTNWDPNGIIRLFNKQKCHWAGEIHEEVTTGEEIGRLYDCIYHDNYRTVQEFMARQDNYSTLRAGELYSQHVRFSRVRNIQRWVG